MCASADLFARREFVQPVLVAHHAGAEARGEAPAMAVVEAVRGGGMRGPDAPYTPEQSVRGMRQLVEKFGPSMNARFFRFDGSEMPW